jgi:hypothetical protein
MIDYHFAGRDQSWILHSTRKEKKKRKEKKFQDEESNMKNGRLLITTNRLPLSVLEVIDALDVVLN